MLQIIPENTGFGSNAGVIKTKGNPLPAVQKKFARAICALFRMIVPAIA